MPRATKAETDPGINALGELASRVSYETAAGTNGRNEWGSGQVPRLTLLAASSESGNLGAGAEKKPEGVPGGAGDRLDTGVEFITDGLKSARGRAERDAGRTNSVRTAEVVVEAEPNAYPGGRRAEAAFASSSEAEVASARARVIRGADSNRRGFLRLRRLNRRDEGRVDHAASLGGRRETIAEPGGLPAGRRRRPSPTTSGFSRWWQRGTPDELPAGTASSWRQETVMRSDRL